MTIIQECYITIAFTYVKCFFTIWQHRENKIYLLFVFCSEVLESFHLKLTKCKNTLLI